MNSNTAKDSLLVSTCLGSMLGPIIARPYVTCKAILLGVILRPWHGVRHSNGNHSRLAQPYQGGILRVEEQAGISFPTFDDPLAEFEVTCTT